MPEWVFWFLFSSHWYYTIPLSPVHMTPQTGDTCELRSVYQCSLAVAWTGVFLTLGCASGQTSMTLPQQGSLLSGDMFCEFICKGCQNQPIVFINHTCLQILYDYLYAALLLVHPQWVWPFEVCHLTKINLFYLFFLLKGYSRDALHHSDMWPSMAKQTILCWDSIGDMSQISCLQWQLSI